MGWREALFSLKTFGAALLALFVAFRLDLPQPTWALLTALIVSRPVAGMVASKSLFRVLGTAAGASMALLLVAMFAQAAPFFIGALARQRLRDQPDGAPGQLPQRRQTDGRRRRQRFLLHSRVFRGDETRTIHDNDRASVRPMAFAEPIEGHVEGIARAITDREAPVGGDLIANPNPTFSWVRLAQRIPVRIAIDWVPDSVRLSAGMTATIMIEPPAKHADGPPPR